MEMGFSDIKSKDAGPDFVAEKNGETFCFEVVTPTPRDSIRELIERGELTSEERDLVFRERLLSVSKRLVRTVLIFTESSDQLSRATDRVPGLPASPGYVQ